MSDTGVLAFNAVPGKAKKRRNWKDILYLPLNKIQRLLLKK